jgi:hypothetical protein
MAHPCGHALVCVRARVQTEEFNAALAAREAALYCFSRALVRAKVGSGSEGVGGGSRFGLGPVASHRGLKSSHASLAGYQLNSIFPHYAPKSQYSRYLLSALDLRHRSKIRL